MKRNFIYLHSAICFILLFACPAVCDEELEAPTFKDILNLKSPGSITMSPDGRYILYTIRKADWEKNQYRTQLWLANIETGEIRQLTYNEKSSSNPDWSPDSKYITFVSARDEKSQIHMMPVDGGEARAVTKSKTGVGGYWFSPDGKWIAYTATDEKPKRDKAVEKKYGKFEVFEEKFNIRHLWLCEVETGETEKLVDREDLHVGSFRWSPDGSKIAFSANPDSLIKSFSKSDVYVVTVEGKEIRKLVDLPGSDSGPMWSPCGEYIAFGSKMGEESYLPNNEICVIHAEGGDITCLTKDFDENKYLMDWKEDGIYFSAREGMTSHIYRINKEKKIERITNWDLASMRGGSLSADGSRMAFSFVDADHYPELYWSEVSEFEPKKLTDFSEQVKSWNLSSKEAIKWKSQDGTEITGVLAKPADFDPDKKYPLFVIIHGGPTGIDYPSLIDGYNRYYPIEQWCAKGALVLTPNYRGSAGFGEAFRSLNYRNLGVGDYWDVISGVDYLVGQGFIDNDKLGAMGWSQGGYISAYITTFSDRFKAVSVGAGISDWVDYYYRTDITPFCIHYLGATPWADPEVYRKTSPMTHINNAKTPTLIQHGENDARVPINNAHKLYRGLKDRDIPVKFIIYKGFGHGISKPKEQLAVLTHNWRWFSKYIWGEEPEEEKFEEEEEDKEEKEEKN